ncbi:dUTP diphosphatase [bacterium]|nr:dUTP diphosphatase [bacterium]
MQKVPVKLKLFDPTLPTPAYQTAGAAAFDLYSRLNVTIKPHQTLAVPTNIAVQLPPEYWLLVAARSSLHKKGLQVINGIGVIDTDYCGDDDEICVLLYNFSDQAVTINQGDRLAQGIIISRTQAEFTLVDHLGCTNRGGFGSTGQQ